MRTYKEQTTKILEKIEEHKIQKTKRKKRIYISLACVSCFAVSAILIATLPNMLKNTALENHISSSKTVDGTGVFIPATKLPKTDDGVAMDMIGLVVYNGKVYTQAEYLWCDNETKKSFVGEFLGTASGTIDEWSSKTEYDKEFASNVTGDVYTVNGYDKDFRICIPQMNEDSEFIAFFENLNGIRLSTGSDLYGERLKLKGNFNDVVYQLHSDWNYSKNNYKHYTNITNDDIPNFINVLYESPFVDLSESTHDIYDENLKQAHIYFKMNNGTTIGIRLFEDGYVSYDNMYGRVFVKMDNNIFEKVFTSSLQ